MANVTPAGNGGSSRKIVYTAQERAADPAGVNTLRMSQQALDRIAMIQTPEQLADAMEAVNDAYNPLDIFRGISPSASKVLPYGSRAMQFRAIYEAEESDFYGTDPSTGRRIPEPWAGSVYQEEAGLPKYLFDQGVYAERFYDPKTGLQKSTRDLIVGVAAPLSDYPTSSSNYLRPRTVAAGWLRNPEFPNEGTLTVVFRDGTMWNYYGVPVEDWNKFHWSYSKGALLKPNREEITFTSDGPADVNPDDPGMKELYKAARTAQIMYRETRSRTGYTTKGTVGSQGGGSARRIKTNLRNNYANSRNKTASTGGANPSAKNGVNPNQK